MKINLLKNKLALVVSLSVVVLFATLAYASTVTPIATGTIAYSELFDGPATLTVRKLSLAPGEVSGWHVHPGKVYNVVTKGTVIVEDGCGQELTVSEGQAFEKVDGRVHRAKNLGTEASEEINTFVMPQGNPLSVPIAERLCGPPRNTNECKNGWANFSYPRVFSNEGDCMQYVITGK